MTTEYDLLLIFNICGYPITVIVLWAVLLSESDLSPRIRTLSAVFWPALVLFLVCRTIYRVMWTVLYNREWGEDQDD